MHQKDLKYYRQATLIMMSPNGHTEYIRGLRFCLESMIGKDGYVTDRYGFKWKAWIE